MQNLTQTHGFPMARTLTGIPTVAALATCTVRLPSETIFLQVSAGSACRLYFSREEFERVVAGGASASDAYLPLAGTSLFFSGPAQVRDIYVLGIGAAVDVTVVGYRKVA